MDSIPALRSRSLSSERGTGLVVLLSKNTFLQKTPCPLCQAYRKHRGVDDGGLALGNGSAGSRFPDVVGDTESVRVTVQTDSHSPPPPRKKKFWFCFYPCNAMDRGTGFPIFRAW